MFNCPKIKNLGKNASYLGTDASDRKMDIKFVFSDPKTPRNVFSGKIGVAPLFVRNAYYTTAMRQRIGIIRSDKIPITLSSAFAVRMMIY